ncbi:MAG: hypothetical protein MJ250_06820 [Alphaproteobacteria bacterium]|nr:hypothetical protein [Alphaproteobacteria bacterium]
MSSSHTSLGILEPTVIVDKSSSFNSMISVSFVSSIVFFFCFSQGGSPMKMFLILRVTDEMKNGYEKNEKRFPIYA